MFQIRLGKRPPVGSRPGSFVLPEDAVRPKIRVITYSEQSLEEKEVTSYEEIRSLLSPDTQCWIDVQGMGDEDLLRGIQSIFDVHPLSMEDVIHVPQRPKVEAHNRQLLLITRMLQWKEKEAELAVEQVSIVVGPNAVITFQEKHGDVLEPVRQRIRNSQGLIRNSGPDYLAYALLDTIVDAYFPLLESLGDRIEALEESIMENPTPSALRTLNKYRQSILAIRRAVWPTREAVSELIRLDHEVIQDATRAYLRDTYDHCIQTVDIVESYREIAAGLMNTYLSVVSNRMNEIMKVLTIMASIFIPLTFLAGIYGMNFEFIPELKIKWAYFALLALMAVIAFGMLVYFRGKGWIGFQGPNETDD